MDGIILINKEKGYTSFDVVNIAKKVLHTKKVGHCGTLDPDATGVLVLCVNKATKALQFLQSDEKEYICTLSLGKSTDTYDAGGKVLEEVPFNGVNNVEETLNSFLGISTQIPPIYSAIKVNGKKLYQYARENKEVEIEPRTINIKEIELISIKDNLIDFRVICSKGTYVRSLCVDIAKKLGYPGHMSNLIRSRSGHFKLEDCYSIENLKSNHFKMISLDDAFKDFPSLTVDDEKAIICGKLITSDIDHRVAIWNKDHQLLAIYEPNGNGQLKCVRGLF